MVRRFIYKIKENDMMVVRIGYRDVVMSVKDAVTMGEILQRAEKYEKKLLREDGAFKSGYTYHVWPNEEEFAMTLISDDLYRMAKMAGMAEDK
jgi:hypothetical protein